METAEQHKAEWETIELEVTTQKEEAKQKKVTKEQQKTSVEDEKSKHADLFRHSVKEKAKLFEEALKTANEELGKLKAELLEA